MDEAQAVNKTEANLPQGKIEFINHTHAKEVEYWKNVAFEGKNEDQKKESTDLAPLRFFWLVKML